MVLQRLLSITRAAICGGQQQVVTGGKVMAREHASTRQHPPALGSTQQHLLEPITYRKTASTHQYPQKPATSHNRGKWLHILGVGCRVPAGINHQRDDDPCLSIAEWLLSVGTHAALA